MTMLLRIAEFAVWRPSIYMFDKVLDQIVLRLEKSNPSLALSLKEQLELSMSTVSIKELDEDEFSSIVAALKDYHSQVLHNLVCPDAKDRNESNIFMNRLSELKMMLVLDERNHYVVQDADVVLGKGRQWRSHSWLYELVMETVFAYLNNQNVCGLAETVINDLDNKLYYTDLSDITDQEFQEFQSIVLDLYEAYKTGIRGFHSTAEIFDPIKGIASLRDLVMNDSRAKV
jgi:hypothetical protein